MKAARSIIVTATPDLIGAALPGTELIRAIELAQVARAAGLEGRIYVTYDDNTVEEYDPAARTKAARARLPWVGEA